MRVLLVNPPIPNINLIVEHTDVEMEINKRELMGPPLALNDIAGALRDDEVRIVDQKFEYDEDPNYDFEEVIHNEVTTFGPDIVGISCFTAHVNSAKKILKVVRDYNPNVLTVVGGLHPTLNPQDFCMPEVDLVAIGLGKRTMRSIVDESKANPSQPDFSKIPGLAIRVDGNLKFTRQLSELSRKEIRDEHYFYYDGDAYFPDRDLTKRYNYMIEVRQAKIQYMNTSLGCTDKCTFCGLWKYANGYYIPRDVECIAKDIKTMDEYPIIRMVDSHTFGDPKHAKLMFETLIDQGLIRRYIVDVRTDTVVKYPELLALAAKAGVKIAIIGFEATTDEELDKYNKGTTVANTVKALDTLHDLGIFCSGNYIIDPDYEERDFERIAQFIDDHPILFAGFTVMTPFPGTQQYEMMKERITIKDLDYYNLVNSVVKTKLPEDVFYSKIVELYMLSRKARMKFMKKYGVDIRKG